MITCSQCRDELAEYALGQAAEPEAVAEHLRACTVCRTELHQIEAAWSVLPLTLPTATGPSDELFDRIAARIDSGLTRPLARRPTATAVPRASALSRRERVASYLLAASVLLGLTFAALSYKGVLWPEGASLAATPEERAVQDLAKRLGNLQQMERLLQSGNVRIVSLENRSSPDGVEAYVVWDMTANQWHLFALRLPAAPAGQTYQVWVADRQGTLHAGPTFVINDSGLGSAVVDLPAGGAGKAVITLEPASGSQAPTTPPILEATL